MPRYKFLAVICILFLLAALTAVGCSQDSSVNELPPGNGENTLPLGEEDFPANDPPADESELPLTDRELVEYRPNELGQVMILMYHSIGPEEAEWTRTPENFRKDLEELYARGYRLVSLLDYVRGDIDLPAGTSPVILTFDDSSRGQFNYIDTETGLELDPNSAVGILEDFYEERPDFGRAAGFYIYYPVPFRQRDTIQRKLEFLRDNGYEIGNHNYTHRNLAKIPPEEALKELALHARTTAEYLPGYEVLSLALPYGARPKDQSLLDGGTYDGFTYRLEAVLNVGSKPAPSPFHTGFNSMSLPRIRASETKVDNVGIYSWIEYFERNPEQRYVSDGKPGYITAPEEYRGKIYPGALFGQEVHFYSLDSN